MVVDQLPTGTNILSRPLHVLLSIGEQAPPLVKDVGRVGRVGSDSRATVVSCRRWLVVMGMWLWEPHTIKNQVAMGSIKNEDGYSFMVYAVLGIASNS